MLQVPRTFNVQQALIQLEALVDAVPVPLDILVHPGLLSPLPRRIFVPSDTIAIPTHIKFHVLTEAMELKSVVSVLRMLVALVNLATIAPSHR